MRPKRQSRAAQLQPQPALDSETSDNPAAAPTLAPPPPRSTTSLNLTVLRRYIPALHSLQAIAPFAVLYTFSPDSQQWEKCGVEGTLFVCRLLGERYSVFIMNRKSLENFEADLRSADEVEVAGEYVILQVGGVIYGVWIFEDGGFEEGGTGIGTRERVAGSIVGAALRAQIAREAGAVDGDGAVEDEQGTDDGEGEEGQEDYGMDGTTQMQEQMEEEEAVEEQAGQKLDLLDLFGSRPAAESYASAAPPSLPESALPSRFAATADTDFFRTSRSPAVPQQQQQPRAPQNALLDLFKT
ncbi:hypothetical protein LTR53_003773 [Teratosphaeriaceae sp. CCFEE 6253]|nr:hypothetical protein LTR53_003773 [Teratosphaeriaceae sp. CCFEE 6253]